MFFIGLAAGLAVWMVAQVYWMVRVGALKVQLAGFEKERELEQRQQEREEGVEVKLRETFKALAADVLHANSQMLAEGARKDLTTVVEPLQKGLESLDGHVRELEKKRAGAYHSLEQQLGQMREAHTRLQETTLTLSEALRSPTVRGRWGELQLRRVVEMSGMENHVDFDEQVSGEQGRPDLVVYLPNGGILPVDSKVPLDAYLAANEATDEVARRQHMSSHAQAMRNTVRELSKKEYWSQFEKAPDFVVMFVPNEACLGAAYEADSELLTYAMSNSVLVTSPVTLLALLRTVAYGWQQHQVSENAMRIAQEGRELAGRLETFVDRFADVGKSLDKTVDSYNKAVGSLDRRLMPAARRFSELGAATTEPTTPEPLDRQARLPAKP
jgi:DNA recombination protein RmuC